MYDNEKTSSYFMYHNESDLYDAGSVSVYDEQKWRDGSYYWRPILKAYGGSGGADSSGDPFCLSGDKGGSRKEEVKFD